MLLITLLAASAACAILPAILFCINLRRFRPPAAVPSDDIHPISVLIPARNEETNIGPALLAVLASRNVDLEILVWDDDSTDNTAAVVHRLSDADTRIHLLPGTSLPPGWNGKQHACWQLAQASSQPTLVFLDADVRIHPDLLARMAAFRTQTNTGLVSGFPRLITLTWLEKLLLPLIHFILLGFLPMRAMRHRTWPSAAAGCGQFLLADRRSYFHAGGHNAIRETMHDGLLLPRIFRRASYKTDIADITHLAHVRMYDSAAKVWQGLAKNATEGIASPGKIIPFSLILLLGQVLPALLALWIAALASVLGLFAVAGESLWPYILRSGSPWLISLYIMAHGGFALNVSYTQAVVRISATFLAAVLCTYLPRLLAVRRFQQPLSSALLHPLGVLTLLTVQWYALTRKLIGKPVGWRQRQYSSASGVEVRS